MSRLVIFLGYQHLCMSNPGEAGRDINTATSLGTDDGYCFSV
jgi:hypothetical protein